MKGAEDPFAEEEAKKRALVEQLGPLRDVLTVWEALTGIQLVNDGEILPTGWMLTFLAAMAPVVALQLLSLTGRAYIRQITGMGSTGPPAFPMDGLL